MTIHGTSTTHASRAWHRPALLALGLLVALQTSTPVAWAGMGTEATCDGATTCWTESRLFPGPDGQLMVGEVRVRDGVAYFQGDIVVPSSAIFSGATPRNPLTTWPDAEIPYEIASGFPSDHVIFQAIAEWNSNTVVDLVHRSQRPDATHWVTFTPSEDGCNSAIGRVGAGQPIRLEASCARSIGTVLHEIGHAAGLFHEQMRGDRDDYVEIRWENIKDAEAFNFELAEGSWNLGPYDFGSVMHYGADAFSKNGLPTIVPKVAGVTIGQREGLSPGDIAGIAAMYVEIEDVAEASDNFGHAVAACDFDGDGAEDLAVGVPLEDVDGVRDAGAVHVIYGSGPQGAHIGAGLQHQRNQIWHLGVLSRTGPPTTYDRFGHALATGDFNGDGYCDLAAAAPYRAVNGIPRAGEVAILYGTWLGLYGQHHVVRQPGTTGFDGGGGPEAYDYFGYTLAAGDFNEDGVDDLAIGVPYEDVDDAKDAGVVNMMVGLDGYGVLAISRYWHQDSAGIAGVVAAGDRFGRALAVGDFNGDGADDLAIGVPYEDYAAVRDSGAVHLIHGRKQGGWSLLTEEGDELIAQAHSGMAEIVEASDRFGAALAAGDFDGDGAFDLAIGVPGEDVGSVGNAGIVHVLKGRYGTPSLGGLSRTGVRMLREPVAVYGNGFGWTLAAIRGEGGVYDLAVGVPYADLFDQGATQYNAGLVRVFDGARSTGIASWSRTWHRAMPEIGHVADMNEGFGKYGLTAGDFDGNGRQDLAIGVVGQDVYEYDELSFGELATNAGAVHVLYDDVHFGSGLSATGNRIFSQNH